jgi:hypothetical protein
MARRSVSGIRVRERHGCDGRVTTTVSCLEQEMKRSDAVYLLRYAIPWEDSALANNLPNLPNFSEVDPVCYAPPMSNL